MRRARDREMPDGLMGEPAWDMLLGVYSSEPPRLSDYRLCQQSGLPDSTARRWLKVLTERDLLEPSPDEHDGDAIQYMLTERGRKIVERSLEAMLRGPS